VNPIARSVIWGIRGAVVIIIEFLLTEYSIPFLEEKDNIEISY